METLKRTVYKRIVNYLKSQKFAVVFGARRVGKSILARQLLKAWQGQSLFLSGEDYDAQALLEPCSPENYHRLLDKVGLLVIDDAQSIPGIEQKLKLMVDVIPHIRIIAAGFSSLDRARQIMEPLVGRSAGFHLNAFSQPELSAGEDPLEIRWHLETRLIYGSYPEVALLNETKQKAQCLRELINSSLLRDILTFEGLKNFSKMRELLRFMAFQTGQEVSYDELGKELGISKNTAEKYLYHLTQAFIVYRLGAYSRNLRKEVSKVNKWYFYDNGVRNALIGNFNPLNSRPDIENLWENYLISERIKNRDHTGGTEEFYFWRTYDRQKLELVEDYSVVGESPFLAAFDFTWRESRAVKEPPVAFASAYPGASYKVINRENYTAWIT